MSEVTVEDLGHLAVPQKQKRLWLYWLVSQSDKSEVADALGDMKTWSEVAGWAKENGFLEDDHDFKAEKIAESLSSPEEEPEDHGEGESEGAAMDPYCPGCRVWYDDDEEHELVCVYSRWED